jgi:hypothetical protein
MDTMKCSLASCLEVRRCVLCMSWWEFIVRVLVTDELCIEGKEVCRKVHCSCGQLDKDSNELSVINDMHRHKL